MAQKITLPADAQQVENAIWKLTSQDMSTDLDLPRATPKADCSPQENFPALVRTVLAWTMIVVWALQWAGEFALW